jgi:hypothetical protein
MSKVLSEQKAEAIATEYLCNGFKKVDALLKLGYAKSYANSKVGLRLYDNDKVINAINRLQAKTAIKADITIEDIVNGIKSVINNPTANNSDKLKGYELLGKYKAMFKEVIKQDQQPESINPEQQKVYDKAAQEAIDKLARNNIRIA